MALLFLLGFLSFVEGSIKSFGIFVVDPSFSTVTLQLYWANDMYQCSVVPIQTSQYRCLTTNASTLLISSNNPQQYYMQIYNNDDDNLGIDSIFVIDENDNAYIIDDFCASEPLVYALTHYPQFSTSNNCHIFTNQSGTESLYMIGLDNDNHKFISIKIYFREKILDHPNTIGSGYLTSSFVQKFGFMTSSDAPVLTSGVLVTLFWNLEIIQCVINPLMPDTMYYCDVNQATVCFNNHRYQNQYKLLIENDHIDTLKIQSVVVHDKLTYYYGISTFCVNNNISQSGRSILDNNCSSPSQFQYFQHVCSDNANCNAPYLDISFEADFFTKPLTYDSVGIVMPGVASSQLTCAPTSEPTTAPSTSPTSKPTVDPTLLPSKASKTPTNFPSTIPSQYPSQMPSISTFRPTENPSLTPTIYPSKYPTISPTYKPTDVPTVTPTTLPTIHPSNMPSTLTNDPSVNPTKKPTKLPSNNPSISPTDNPIKNPSVAPTKNPSKVPSFLPTITTNYPTLSPTFKPSTSPRHNTKNPSEFPSNNPSISATNSPTKNPSTSPTTKPSNTSTLSPITNAPITPITITENPSKSPSFNPLFASSESIITGIAEMTAQTEYSNLIVRELNIGSALQTLIIIVAIIDLIMLTFCLYYVFKKTFHRAQEPYNASWKNAIKEFRFMDYVGVIIEIFDISTDYIFAANLIVSKSMGASIIMLGWISLIVSVFGIILFFCKYSMLKKLLGVQTKRYRKELTKIRDNNRRTEIMKEIRIRRIDIDVLGLLNCSIEDLPQIMIILIYLSNLGFSYISVATISMSSLSVLMKLFDVVMTKFGCNDVDDQAIEHTSVPTQELDHIELEQTMKAFL